MNLPDLTKMDISKKMLMALVGSYFVSEMQELKLALIVAALIAVGIVCQTVIDVKGVKNVENNNNPNS